ncbi:uncharacterized protein PRCAT00000172001 [Priceomyces carsonii]|uniref:uncharacterized protein n=1 Tax=Priceomyces carsonii TaxID=28549 RepID=UPI002ED8E360|nr:unnamed protein product [Priceomyces carsonii]
MVLYKRKPVIFSSPPSLPVDMNSEVFFIPHTKEWFYNYEDYVARMDYYNTKKFVCEITGNSCLTFFEAMESEEREIKGVEKNFPETLREHILRFLQFSRITRLDQLVDRVYLVFKDDYFPGETIFIKGPMNEVDQDRTAESHSTVKYRGTIREKVQYGSSDSVTTKYLVVRLSDMQEAIVTGDRISRDRNHFTKWLIKTFIKLTMSRSHKVGAPWVVKEVYAKEYRIPQEFPNDLKQFASTTPTGEVLYEDNEKGGSPTPAVFGDRHSPGNDKRKRSSHQVKGLKRKKLLSKVLDVKNSSSPTPKLESERRNSPILIREILPLNSRKRFPMHHLPEKLLNVIEHEDGMGSDGPGTPSNYANGLSGSSIQPTKKNLVEDLTIPFDLQNRRPQSNILKLPDNSLRWNRRIIENHRLLLKSKLNTEDDIGEITRHTEITRLSQHDLYSVQDALQVWVFLNVYHEALNLDSFTFDDFLYAMGWNLKQFEDHGRCELLDEIWCSVLSAMVSNEPCSEKQTDEAESSGTVPGLLFTIPQNKLQVSQSDLEDSRSELNSQDTEEDSAGISDNTKEKNIDSPDEDHFHNAYMAMNYRNTTWDDRLRKRNFKDGSWQCILLGALSLVEHIPKYKLTIDRLFRILAPYDMSPSPNTVLRQFYEFLDIDLRLQALSILVSLLSTGAVVRRHIDDCLETSAALRRSRLDHIRDFRVALEDLLKQNQILQNILTSSYDTDQVKRSKIDLRALMISDEEKQLIKTNQEFKNAFETRKDLLKRIEDHKKAKREVEKKLVELDCQRVKLLGKDRFFNRYWWFENNGLPTLHSGSKEEEEDDDDDGVKEKSDISDDENEKEDSLDSTYLMGTLWVQGPSEDDLRIHLEMTQENAEFYLSELQHPCQNNSDAGPYMENNSTIGKLITPKIEEEHYENGNLVAPLQKMNFENLPKRFKSTALKFGVKFNQSDVFKVDEKSGSEELALNEYGGLPDFFSVSKLSNIQRKIIEENSDLLFNGCTWRYYCDPDEIDGLIEWLNPWGKRESQLRKELLSVKDSMIRSMKARKKALYETFVPDEESSLTGKIIEVERRIQNFEKEDELVSDGDIKTQDHKRSLRKKVLPRKRQKLNSIGDILKNGDLESLIDLKHALKLELETKVIQREASRVLKYTNNIAQEHFEKSLYLGGDKKLKSGRKPNKLKA